MNRPGQRVIAYINERLNAWARWRVSDRALLRIMLGAHNCWPQMLGEAVSTATIRQQGTLVPLNDIECCVSDQAVCSLPGDLRETVTEYYTRIGTADTLAKRLGVSKVTIFRRIDRAHWHIQRYLAYVPERDAEPPPKKTLALSVTKAYKTGYAGVNVSKPNI